MTDELFLTRGARIAYQLVGSGPPLGYAHGVTVSREVVRRQGLVDIESLGTGRRFLTYDQRAHGQSTGRPIAEDYRFESYTLDLLALMDKLGIDEPMDLIGSSLGTDTALRAAIGAPHRFHRLILIIPPAAWDSDAVLARQWYFDAADAIEARGVAAWLAEEERTGRPSILEDFPAFDLTPDVADELLPAVLRGAGMSDLPALEEVATLRHPTLVLAWDTDPLHPVSVAERLHELLPNSALHVSTSAGDIRTWTGRIADFLAS